MNTAQQKVLQAYFDGKKSNGEISAFVLRRIRMDSTFGQQEKTAQIWAVNFALVTIIINLFLLLQKLPYRLLLNAINNIRQIAAIITSPAPPAAIFMGLLLISGIAVLTVKMLGGKKS